MRVPTRQSVRLGDVPSMVRARLDFSASSNGLVGYTDSQGDYIVKSYGLVIACWLEEGDRLWVMDKDDEDIKYESTANHISYVKQGIDIVRKTLAKV